MQKTLRDECRVVVPPELEKNPQPGRYTVRGNTVVPYESGSESGSGSSQMDIKDFELLFGAVPIRKSPPPIEYVTFSKVVEGLENKENFKEFVDAWKILPEGDNIAYFVLPDGEKIQVSAEAVEKFTIYPASCLSEDNNEIPIYADEFEDRFVAEVVVAILHNLKHIAPPEFEAIDVCNGLSEQIKKRSRLFMLEYEGGWKEDVGGQKLTMLSGFIDEYVIKEASELANTIFVGREICKCLACIGEYIGCEIITQFAMISFVLNNIAARNINDILDACCIDLTNVPEEIWAIAARNFSVFPTDVLSDFNGHTATIEEICKEYSNKRIPMECIKNCTFDRELFIDYAGILSSIKNLSKFPEIIPPDDSNGVVKHFGITLDGRIFHTSSPLFKFTWGPMHDKYISDTPRRDKSNREKIEICRKITAAKDSNSEEVEERAEKARKVLEEQFSSHISFPDFQFVTSDLSSYYEATCKDNSEIMDTILEVAKRYREIRKECGVSEVWQKKKENHIPKESVTHLFQY